MFADIKSRAWIHKWKKIYCPEFNMYRQFVDPKISYISNKTLIFTVICNIYGNNNHAMFKEGDTIVIFKILGLINNINK